MYKEVKKYCKGCDSLLILHNNRDVKRRGYCSKSCAAIHKFSILKERTCSVCGKHFKPTNNSQINCSSNCTKSVQIERSYKYLNNNITGYIKHLIAKPGRKHIPLEYFLELYDKQKGKCAISNIDMTFIKKLDGIKIHTNLSIDRIDSSRGYEIGNIQLVCAVVNIMKTTLSMNELMWWCNQIVKDK